jgi:hypothetical protein
VQLVAISEVQAGKLVAVRSVQIPTTTKWSESKSHLLSESSGDVLHSSAMHQPYTITYRGTRSRYSTEIQLLEFGSGVVGCILFEIKKKQLTSKQPVLQVTAGGSHAPYLLFLSEITIALRSARGLVVPLVQQYAV